MLTEENPAEGLRLSFDLGNVTSKPRDLEAIAATGWRITATSRSVRVLGGGFGAFEEGVEGGAVVEVAIGDDG